MSKTNIEWTEETWNPTTGCTKISPGCAHCYIERTPPFRMAGRRFEKGHIPLQLHEDRLDTPLHWRKPRRVFVNSLSDLFHADVPDGFIDRVFAVMALANRHTFQVLTKRPERMREYFLAAKSRIVNELVRMGRMAEAIVVERGLLLDDKITPKPRWPLPNVWLGVSVEDQQRADERIPLLLETPAAVRFLSCEPLLAPVDVSRYLVPGSNLAKVDWVIAGGESGPRARPCDLAWVRSLVRQCKAAEVPVFVKQLGSNIRGLTDSRGLNHDKIADILGSTYRLKDSKGGDITEFPEDLQVREFP